MGEQNVTLTTLERLLKRLKCNAAEVINAELRSANHRTRQARRPRYLLKNSPLVARGASQFVQRQHDIQFADFRR